LRNPGAAIGHDYLGLAIMRPAFQSEYSALRHCLNRVGDNICHGLTNHAAIAIYLRQSFGESKLNPYLITAHARSQLPKKLVEVKTAGRQLPWVRETIERFDRRIQTVDRFAQFIEMKIFALLGITSEQFQSELNALQRAAELMRNARKQPRQRRKLFLPIKFDLVLHGAFGKLFEAASPMRAHDNLAVRID